MAPGKPKDAPNEMSVDAKTAAVFQRKQYKILNKLGAGAFGTVYKATRMDTGELAAVKVMDLDKMTENYKAKFLPRELVTLIDTKHENIIEVFDIIRANHKLYIFMEFAANGDISGYAKKNNGIKCELASLWFLQMAYGLTHLHEILRTSHRDIKLDNFLLNKNFTAKLTDFGFAKISADNEGNVIISKTYCGTVPYYAPKVLKRVPYDPFKADVFSMGVSFYIMLHNRFPFHFKDSNEHFNEMCQYPNYIRSRYNEYTPRQSAPLIEGMLEPEESKRMNARDITRFGWLKNTARECEYYTSCQGEKK